MNVYIDVLFLLNFFITYFLLRLCAIICRRKSKIIRICLAGIIGAFSSVAILFDVFSFLSVFIFKIILASSIIFAAFYKCSLKIFIKLTITFIMLTSLFGGVVFLLYTFTPFSRIIILNNGFCYFDIPPYVMLICSFIFIVFIIYLEFSSCKLTKASIYEVLITYKNNKVRIPVFLDTGNNLYELITRKPVILIEYDFIKDNLLSETADFIKQKIENDCVNIDTVSQSNYRIVKLSTAAGDGFVFAFEPDNVIIEKNGKEIDRNIRTCIGVVNRKLSHYGETAGIMHPDLIK